MHMRNSCTRDDHNRNILINTGNAHKLPLILKKV